jgi:hypothetical protein
LEGPFSTLFNIPLFPATFIKTIPSEMQSMDGESTTYKSTSIRQINPPKNTVKPGSLTEEEMYEQVMEAPAKDRTQELQ